MSKKRQTARFQQDLLDMVYKVELNKFYDRKSALKANVPKCYSIIFGEYCTHTMQLRIEALPNFESTIKNDPIELIKAIRILMHEPTRAKYHFSTMTEVVLRFLTMTQHEKESLIDFVKRFKQQRDVLKTYCGEDVLHTFIEGLPAYQASGDANEQQKMKDDSFEQWCAFMLIRNANSSKYGSLVTGMVSQFSMNHNQYPTTIKGATDILVNHKFNKKPKNRNGNGNGKTPKNDKSSNKK